jgi:hypothetical protein
MFGTVYQPPYGTPLYPWSNSEADLKPSCLYNAMADCQWRLCGFGIEGRGRNELYYYYYDLLYKKYVVWPGVFWPSVYN